MEITIKRPGQFGDGSVLIEVRADQGELNILDQAERAGKVPALEAQVLDLKNALSGVRGHSEGLEERIQDLVAERDALLLRVESYDHDRHTEQQRANAEKQRADENREWAERTEAHLETRTRERDAANRKTEQAEVKLTRIRDLVWNGALDESIEHRGQPAAISVGNVGKLAEAVSVIRSVVGQP